MIKCHLMFLTSQLSGSKNSFFLVATRNSSRETSLSLFESTCDTDKSRKALNTSCIFSYSLKGLRQIKHSGACLTQDANPAETENEL